MLSYTGVTVRKFVVNLQNSHTLPAQCKGPWEGDILRDSTGITQGSEPPLICDLQSLLLHGLSLTNLRSLIGTSSRLRQVHRGGSAFTYIYACKRIYRNLNKQTNKQTRKTLRITKVILICMSQSDMCVLGTHHGATSNFH